MEGQTSLQAESIASNHPSHPYAVRRCQTCGMMFLHDDGESESQCDACQSGVRSMQRMFERLMSGK